jgi:hypothetical protein
MNNTKVFFSKLFLTSFEHVSLHGSNTKTYRMPSLFEDIFIRKFKLLQTLQTSTNKCRYFEPNIEFCIYTKNYQNLIATNNEYNLY